MSRLFVKKPAIAPAPAPSTNAACAPGEPSLPGAVGVQAARVRLSSS